MREGENMEELELKDLDLNETCFHFTYTANLDSIKEKGLVSRIGDHARGIEANKKIYFSKGIDNVIRLMERWYRFELAIVVAKKYRVPIREFVKHPEIMIDPECIEIANEIFLDKMKKSTYLAVDLEEGKHYDHEILDELKLKSSKEGLDFFYGKDRDASSRIEGWNMQTYDDIIIEPERIAKINPKNGKSAWDLVKEMQLQCSIKPSETPYLNQVMNYEKKQEIELKKAPR